MVEVRAVAVEIKAALSEKLPMAQGAPGAPQGGEHSISPGRSQTNTCELISALSSNVCFSLCILPSHTSFPGEALSWCLTHPLALECLWLHCAPAGK